MSADSVFNAIIFFIAVLFVLGIVLLIILGKEKFDMNRNRNLVIDFQVNHKHDHFINKPEDRHTQPHQPKIAATKPYKLYHKKEEKTNENSESL